MLYVLDNQSLDKRGSNMQGSTVLNFTYWLLLTCFLNFFLCLKYINIATAIINSASGTASAKTMPITVPLSNELLIALAIVDGVSKVLWLTRMRMNIILLQYTATGLHIWQKGPVQPS